MEGVQTRKGLYGFDFREPDNRWVDRRRYNIKQLWQRSHEIVNLAVRGFNNKQIAEILHINPDTVSNTINSELGQKKLSDIRFSRDEETRKVAEKIRVLTDKALNTYHEVFDDESGELGLKDKGNFATEFLKEMSGLRAPTKIQSQSFHTTLTKQELEEFKQRGIQAARESGMIVDIEDSGTSEVKSEDPRSGQVNHDKELEKTAE